MKKFIATLLAVIMMLPIIANAATLSDLQTEKAVWHEIAEMARELGYREDEPIIKRCSELWWEAHNKINAGEYEPDPIPAPEPSPKPEVTEPDRSGYTKYYTDQDAIMMAKVTFLEARGIKDKVQLACVMWTILNRVDAGYGSIYNVITAPNQFAYRSSAPMTTDYGTDLLALAYDVLERWNREKNGETDVGRVLPKGYLWYSGNGKANLFRNAYRGGSYWNYTLPNPYV